MKNYRGASITDFRLTEPDVERGTFVPSLTGEESIELLRQRSLDANKVEIVPVVMFMLFIGGAFLAGIPVLLQLGNVNFMVGLAIVLTCLGIIWLFAYVNKYASYTALNKNWHVVSELQEYEFERFQKWAKNQYGIKIKNDRELKRNILTLSQLSGSYTVTQDDKLYRLVNQSGSEGFSFVEEKKNSLTVA